MKIYNYCSETGCLKSESQARVCPVTKKDYIIPANATTEKPPENKDGKVASFKDGKWVLVEDNRGKTSYCKETKREIQIDYVGPVEKRCTLHKPPKENYYSWDENNNKWSLKSQDDAVSENVRILVNQYHSDKYNFFIEEGLDLIMNLGEKSLSKIRDKLKELKAKHEDKIKEAKAKDYSI